MDGPQIVIVKCHIREPNHVSLDAELVSMICLAMKYSY